LLQTNLGSSNFLGEEHMTKKTTPAQKGNVSKTATAKAAAKQVANQQFANGIVQQLDALFEVRVKWESTDYKKANEGLYNLLSQCLAVFMAEYDPADKKAQQALRSELTNKLTAAGVKVQSNTSTMTMFVRFVFNADRKRAHGYATVLLAAITDGVDAKDLPAYIVAAGGVEEIKRRHVKSEESIAKQEKLEAAKADVKLEVQMAAAVAPLANVAIEGVSGTYALMLVKPKIDGTVDVVGTLSDLPDSMVEALIGRMAKVRVQAQLKAEVTTKANSPLNEAIRIRRASNDAQMKKAA
jgi:hypothetical protein